MKLDKEAVRKGVLLYVVTDRTWLYGEKLEDQVEKMIEAGATFVQLREKEFSKKEFLEQALKIKKITDQHQIPFVINDNIEVAILCDADGVHIGQSDGSAKEIRKRLGEDKIIGVSVRTISQAKQAEEEGADYVGVGAVFGTTTKKDVQNVTVDNLKEIVESISIPVVAIGGINEKNILELRGSQIDGVAVISALFAKPDKKEATKELVRLAKEVVES